MKDIISKINEGNNICKLFSEVQHEIDKKGEYRLTFNTKKDNSLNSYNLKNLDDLYFLNKTSVTLFTDLSVA